MKKPISALLPLALTMPSAANAADFVKFGEEAQEAVRIVTSIGSCKRFGYDVDAGPQVPAELSDAVLRRAVVNGVDKVTAEKLLLDMLKREQRDLELMSSLPAHVDTKDKLIARFRETATFWIERCETIAASALGAQYVRKSGREGAVQQALIASTIRQIEAGKGGK